MRFKKRLLSVVLVVILCSGMSMTAYATPENQSTDELTPEQQAVQDELNRVYSLPVQTNELANWPQGPGTYGEAAIIMEVGSGAILYAKNIDDHHYPASITKVLTALIALENGNMEDSVTFSHDCVAFLQPGDSSIGMKEGNVITLEQALYATLLASANEAAYAVGENVGKNAGHDYAWFLEQMNTRCKELGGNNSNFANTNGLHDPNHYTCARDMALIGREIFHHPEFFQIVQTMQYTIPASDTTEEHIFQQKHKMLKSENANYYEYAIGGKTGYTSDALSTLITMADNGNMQLVCVVLRTLGKNIYPDTRNLFEYTFQNFQKVDVEGNEQSEDIKEIITEDGGGYVVLPQGVEFTDLEMQFTPDMENQEAVLSYTYGGNPVGEVRAKLSDSYIEEHTVKTEEKKSDKTEKKEEKGNKSTLEKIILAAAAILLVILIGVFVRQVIRYKRHTRKKKRRRR